MIWRCFSNSITWNQSYITQQQFNQWLQPLQKFISVDLLDFDSLIRNRHSIAHEDLRSVANQLAFIANVKKFEFPSNFEHKQLVTDMLQALDKTQLKRFK